MLHRKKILDNSLTYNYISLIATQKTTQKDCVQAKKPMWI